MAQSNNNKKLVSLLLIVIAVLVMLIIAEWGSMSLARQTLLQEVSDVATQGYEIEELPSIDLSKTKLAEYSEMVDRPLFFESRRPIKINNTVAEVPQVVGKFKMSLVGIYGTAKGMSALFKNSIVRLDEKKYYKAYVGDDVQGWRVDEIHDDKVILSQAGSQESVNLRKPRAPKATAKRNKRRIKPPAQPKKTSTQAKMKKPKPKNNQDNKQDSN